VALFTLSAGVTIGTTVMLLQSVRSIQQEQRVVTEFTATVREAQAQISALRDESIARQEQLIAESVEAVNGGFERLRGLELLPTLNTRTEEAFASIQELGSLFEDNIAELRSTRSQLQELAMDVFGYSDTVRLRNFSFSEQGNRFQDQERIETVTDNFIGAISRTTNRLSTTVDVLQRQRTVIDDAVSSRQRLIGLIAGGSLALTVLVVLVLAIAIAVGVGRRVRALETRVGELVEGDLTVEIPSHSKDELGRIGGHLSRFVEVVSSFIKTMKSQSAQNVANRSDLAAVAGQTQSSVTEMRSSTQSISGQINSLEEQLNSSTRSIEEVNKRLTSLNQRTQSQRQSVDSSSESMRSMIGSLEEVTKLTAGSKEQATEMVRSAERGRDQFESSSELVQQLSEYVESVRGMTDTVQNIAEQTNLLAMNAAIEAAHAGEHGKGFAVVAEEIRKLSEASSNSSSEITDTLEKMVQRILEANRATGETRTAFDEIDRSVKSVSEQLEGINQQLSELQDEANAVLGSVDELRRLAGEIEQDTGEIEQHAQTLKDGVQKVKDVSSEVSTGMEEMTNGMGEIANAMETLSEKAETVGRLGDELDYNVRRFTTDEDAESSE
jgi:methyl-accepting chemotaxis protein